MNNEKLRHKLLAALDEKIGAAQQREKKADTAGNHQQAAIEWGTAVGLTMARKAIIDATHEAENSVAELLAAAKPFLPRYEMNDDEDFNAGGPYEALVTCGDVLALVKAVEKAERDQAA